MLQQQLLFPNSSLKLRLYTRSVELPSAQFLWQGFCNGLKVANRTVKLLCNNVASESSGEELRIITLLRIANYYRSLLTLSVNCCRSEAYTVKCSQAFWISKLSTRDRALIL